VEWIVLGAVVVSIAWWVTAIALGVRWLVHWLMPAPSSTVIQVTVNGVDTHDRDV